MTRLHDRAGDARKPERILERFWSHVDKDGPIPEHAPDLGPCWLWTSKVDTKDGYGKFDYRDPTGKRIHVRAHRFALATVAPLGPLYACHRCDNVRCVNPGHMFAGTQLDNRRDCKAKGRTAKAGDAGTVLRSRFKPDDIRAIRARASAGETHSSIGASVGLGQAQVSRIVARQRWAHVT